MEISPSFDFSTAGQIIFGTGSLRRISEPAAGYGRRACVITGSTLDRAAELIAELNGAAISNITLQVSGEPTTDLAARLIEKARNAGCDLVIGIGGGSVIDMGKIIAALLTNPGDLMDYMEVIGGGKKIALQPLPYIAIPTTAGTGAEVTRNGVILSPDHRVKVSIRSILMIPRIAIIDPLLTLSLPQHITASTGLDAFTQLVEPFVSWKANPLTDAICREGLTRVARALRPAYKDGNNILARTDMALAGLFGGLALANAGLGAVHGFAGVIGGGFRAPHGAICARLLPFVMEVNIRSLRARKAASPALARYREIAAIITGEQGSSAEDGVEWVKSICRDLAIPPLRNLGIKDADITEVVEKSMRSSSMKGNPIELNKPELSEILYRAL